MDKELVLSLAENLHKEAVVHLNEADKTGDQSIWIARMTAYHVLNSLSAVALRQLNAK